MKKIILILLFALPIFIWQTAEAQQTEFAPIGAKWYYTYYFAQIPGPGGSTYTTFTSLRDTTVNNLACRIILEQRNYDCLGEASIHKLYHIMYSDSGRVYEILNGDKYLLYDFNKNQGEYWVIPNYGNDTIYVDSTSTLGLLNGQTKKVLYVSKSDNSQLFYNFSGKIIEDIGFESYLLPYLETVPCQFGGPFRCYSENNTLVLSSLLPCDYETVDINNYPKQDEKIKVSTLVENELVIDLTESSLMQNSTITLINSSGSVVYNSNSSNSTVLTINVSHLAKGIYVLNIRSKTNQMNKKVVIY